jgi:hypothetical protein
MSMRNPACCAFACSFLSMLSSVAVAAQPVLERVVGTDGSGKPLVVKTLTAVEIGALAGAARVPMGFEAALPNSPRSWKIEASGRRLREVLDAIVAEDPRYEWREDNGVVVVRPAAAWTEREDVLYRAIGAIRFDDIGVAEALRLAAEMFGSEPETFQRDDMGDAKRFNVDLPPGTILEALNGLVRAHGGLTWGLEPLLTVPQAPGPVPWTFVIQLFSRTGRGHGTGIRLDQAPRISEPLNQWRRPDQQPSRPTLDRIVGRKYNGDVMILRGAFDVPDLAYAARVPMGVELYPASERQAAPEGVRVTGLTVRDALSALVQLDPRYDWREDDGVIVVRPQQAWSASDHPLSRAVAPVHLERVTVIDAINFQQALLEPGMKFTPEPDRGAKVSRFSVDAPRGSLLLLLNAIARSHGELCWRYEELSEEDAAFFGGRSHQIYLLAPVGGGQGFVFR